MPAEIRVIEEKIKTMNIETIQKIILWLYDNRKRPSFLLCYEKENFKSLNILFVRSGIENIHKFYRTGSIGTFHESLSLENVHDFLFKSINRENIEPDLNLLSENSVESFIIRDPESVYLEDSQFISSSLNLGGSSLDISSQDIESYTRFSKTTENFLVALDCEMVITKEGKELGRISIVSKDLHVLYDKYVKPKGDVIDYCTKYSGLTKENTDTGITFELVMKEIRDIIGINTIILGHSLYNDLTVLKIYHTRLIDTSRLFRTSDNYKISLKNLSRKYLNKTIQIDAHSSVEDSIACLNLLSIKIAEYQKLSLEKMKLKLSTEIFVNKRIKIDDLEKYTEEKAINTVFIDTAKELKYICNSTDKMFIILFNLGKKIGYLLWTKEKEIRK